MRSFRAALMIISAGLLTFGIVFTLLEVTRSEAAPGQLFNVPTPTTLATGVRATDSLGSRVSAGAIAIGVPSTGSEVLLRDVQPGDRLDVLASLPAPGDGRPVTAVVVRGATVLQPATASDPLLLEVSPPDAMALAHLVLGGTHLGYIVWSANGGNPPPTQPLDEQTARALLGLVPNASPASSPTTPSVLPAPTSIPTLVPAAISSAQPRFGGFLYQVQDGDTWQSIATVFGLTVLEVKRWNETAADMDPAPRTIVFIPR